MRGIAALALLLAGCLPLSATETPAPTEVPTAKPQATFRSPQDDEFGRLMNAVGGDFEPTGSELDTMWREIFARTQVEGQRPYEPPTGAAPYHSGEVPPVRCASGTAARRWEENAFYCPADGWIVYDELWLREFQAEQREFAPAAVLAHEWGHHVQSLFGQSQYDIQDELQADCFAGMYLAYRELPPGATVFDARTDEFAESLATFFALANEKYSASSWFQANEHGSRFQRMLAFGTGSLAINQGLPWCNGYRDFTHGDVASIGPYRLLNFPGRTEAWQEQAYVIAPESLTTDITSTISLEWLPSLPLSNQPATLEQVGAVAQLRLGGGTVLAPGIDLGPNVGVGTGWMALYDSPPAVDDPRSGMLAVLAPVSQLGGLVIDVSRPGHAPSDPAPGATISAEVFATIAEELTAVYQVVTRLCGPDHSADIANPNWNMACLPEQ